MLLEGFAVENILVKQLEKFERVLIQEISFWHRLIKTRCV